VPMRLVPICIRIVPNRREATKVADGERSFLHRHGPACP
jgi:hypothetical protein